MSALAGPESLVDSDQSAPVSDESVLGGSTDGGVIEVLTEGVPQSNAEPIPGPGGLQIGWRFCNGAEFYHCVPRYRNSQLIGGAFDSRPTVGDRRIDVVLPYLQPENRDRLRQVLDTAKRAWAFPFGADHCHRWVEDARRRIEDMGVEFYDNDDYTIEYAEWRFPPDLNDGYEEHAALMIRFKDGTIIYVDNGYLGTGVFGAFLPNDVPSWQEREWTEAGTHGKPIVPRQEVQLDLQLLRNAWKNVKSWFGFD